MGESVGSFVKKVNGDIVGALVNGTTGGKVTLSSHGYPHCMGAFEAPDLVMKKRRQ